MEWGRNVLEELLGGDDTGAEEGRLQKLVCARHTGSMGSVSIRQCYVY